MDHSPVSTISDEQFSTGLDIPNVSPGSVRDSARLEPLASRSLATTQHPKLPHDAGDLNLGDNQPRRTALDHENNATTHEEAFAHNRESLGAQEAVIGPEGPQKSPSHHIIPRKAVPSQDGYSSEKAVEPSPKHKIFQNWWLEAGACLFFLIALFAVVATLYPHQNRPLPDWPYSISVNALISVYTVILKATIMFVIGEALSQLKWSWYQSDHSLYDLVAYDGAARGLWGSFALLKRIHLTQPLASTGALLAILLFAVDPFTQQMLAYYDCSISLESQQASLPRTNYFFPASNALGESLDTAILPSVQNAMYAGLFSTGPPVSFACSTGNCTFPKPYNTVGFCSGCEDITETVNFNATCGNRSVSLQEELTCSSPDFDTYNLTLPSGLSISGSNDPYPYPTAFGMATTQDNTVEMILARVNALVQNSRQDCTAAEINSTWTCRGYAAFSCSLQPCVRSYTATQVTAGRLVETQTASSGLQQWGLSPSTSTATNGLFGLVDKACVSDHERRSLTAAGYNLNPPTRWLAYNTSFNALGKFPPSVPVPFPQSLLANGCLYLVDHYTLTELWSTYLTSFFYGTIAQELNNFGGSASVPFTGPQSLAPFFNYGRTDLARIDAIFANISHSLTGYARQGGGQANHSAPAPGRAEHYATCLRVRWAWFALPAFVAGATLVVFALTALGTRGMHFCWKSSPLALAFHGLARQPPPSPLAHGGGGGPGDGESGNGRELIGLRAIEEEAKRTVVRLDWDEGGGLGLVRVLRRAEDGNGKGA